MNSINKCVLINYDYFLELKEKDNPNRSIFENDVQNESKIKNSINTHVIELEKMLFPEIVKYKKGLKIFGKKSIITMEKLLHILKRVSSKKKFKIEKKKLKC